MFALSKETFPLFNYFSSCAALHSSPCSNTVGAWNLWYYLLSSETPLSTDFPGDSFFMWPVSRLLAKTEV